MQVLLADKLEDRCLEALRSMGLTVHNRPELKEAALLEALSVLNPEILVVRSTRVTADMMAAAPALELIIRAGAGYDTIDVTAASDRGIFVANCPGKNAVAVAELTFGLILALDRFIPENVLDAREGRWNKAAYSKGRGLKGRTLGVIGLGHIGREVVRRAHAFEMPVVAWSRSLTDELARELGVARRNSPLEVAAEADIVTIHLAATPETRHLANRAFFEAMKPGAYFINTSRSSLVDEEALAWALEHRGIRAALDVMEGEPAVKSGSFAHPLAGHPQVYFTHHIGASTQQAQEAIADEVVRIIKTYLETGHAPNCVNLEVHSPATHLLTVRHLDKVGVLASVLDEVRRANWNVQEMENLIFAGARAACARIRFDGRPEEAVVQRIAALSDVLAVSLIPLEPSKPE
ncbi:Phosphoglycerate dehydrogenase [Rhodothermus marinus SG0.5JP17-172]|uniref:phosphoglycerate dehydrogenase n=1 Tax=Rhodothermus marinus TaxID=29549 RepID=UPI000223DC2A|nr:phosphoglycerate dehydrogenase [Rhodothermus marinus]AEN72636.1 Phosphoglycerate dehydrogenase [Rhodothermus marinus SG0.5JP17-172]